MIKNHWKHIVKILAFMHAVTAVLLFGMTILVQKFSWGEGAVSIGVGTVYVLSCGIGGYLAGKTQKIRKFLWGLGMGLSYGLLLLAVTLAVKKGIDAGAASVALNFLLCLLSGMLGGMVA